jgi:hypothetical protein
MYLARMTLSKLSHFYFHFSERIGNSDAPEFEFCIVTAKYMIECAAVRPVLAEVRRGDKIREGKR